MGARADSQPPQVRGARRMGTRGRWPLIVIGGFALGALLGAISARRRKGRAPDIAHHALVWGIAFALAGLIVTVALERLI